MLLKEINREVFQADGPIVRVSRREIDFLKNRLKNAPRGRVRLCAHPSSEDLLHEMIIVLSSETYVRPHKHLTKSESFHVIEGTVDVVLLEDSGVVKEVVKLGSMGSGRQFFYRISTPIYHTLLIRSSILVVHETTNGPFVASETIFAPWSPDEQSSEIVRYQHELEEAIAKRVTI